MNALRAAIRSIDQVADRLGLKQSTARRMSDATRYWSESGGGPWRSDSHWRGADAFKSDDEWLEIGAEHLELARRLAPEMFDGRRPRVLDWGAGGGANAVHFAPLASEFVAVEIARESLDECGRQVAATCDTTFRPVLVQLTDPEAAVGVVGANIDLFLCFYVLELVPSEEYGLRLMRIAHEVLRPGGVAIVQVKYRTTDRRTRSHVRRYRRNLANMTTYSIDGFWRSAEGCGFDPRAIVLVPKNRLDERYAYFALAKPG